MTSRPSPSSIRCGSSTASIRCSPIPRIDAVVLATPPSGHLKQIMAAANAGKHVYCEKPFTFSKKEAEEAVAAVQKAKRTVAVGYNRRFHPEMIKLHERIRAGDLGTIQHIEASMTYPNALFSPPTVWRADRTEAPCGGLAPMGVHAIDAMIYLCGRDRPGLLPKLRARSCRAAPTTRRSMLFRMKGGMSGYLGTMTTTGAGFSFQVFGSKGWLRLEGVTHVAGASSKERRTRLFGTCKFQPVKGAAGDVGSGAARSFARHVRSVRARRRRWAGVPDPAGADHSRCRGQRSGDPLRQATVKSQHVP